MEILTLVLSIIGVSVALNLVMFTIAYLLQTDKITDISYAATFVLLASYFLFQNSVSSYKLILFGILVLWAFRLGFYLFVRIHEMGRDERFDHIRTNIKSFFLFWVMQGLTCAIVALPIILSFQKELININLFYIGAVVAIFGLIMETIADYQKFNFKKAYPKQFMHKGFWSKLRHPNYTGEILFWWGVFIISLGFDITLLAVISPLWIMLILIKFSGIPILEKQWASKYGHLLEFKNYLKSSDRLIPFIY